MFLRLYVVARFRRSCLYCSRSSLCDWVRHVRRKQVFSADLAFAATLQAVLEARDLREGCDEAPRSSTNGFLSLWRTWFRLSPPQLSMWLPLKKVEICVPPNSESPLAGDTSDRFTLEVRYWALVPDRGQKKALDNFRPWWCAVSPVRSSRVLLSAAKREHVITGAFDDLCQKTWEQKSKFGVRHGFRWIQLCRETGHAR